MRFHGAWAILWTDDDGDHTIELRTPLRNPRAAARVTAFQRDSLDFSNRQVNAIGSGVHELIADIRYADVSQSLIDMLLAGARGKTITVVPDVDDPKREWACHLIEPTAQNLRTIIDSDRGEFEEQQVTIRLRRTNGKAFQ